MMRRRFWIVTIFVVAVALMGLWGFQPSEAQSHPQRNCPVMGGLVNKDVYVDYAGKRIYFCCPACPETFRKDPEKYLRKMEEGGVVLEPAPVDE